MDYQGSAVDLSEDFTVAASNVITTLAFGKEVSILLPTAKCYPRRVEDGLQNLLCINEQLRLWHANAWLPVYVILFRSLDSISAFIMYYFVAKQGIFLLGYVKK